MAPRRPPKDTGPAAPRVGTGKKRGSKTKAAKQAASEAAEAEPLPAVDLDDLAKELVPDGGSKRAMMRRLLGGLVESEESLRVEALAGGNTAARALNETRRQISRLVGFIVVGGDADKGKKHQGDEPGSKTDVPMWVPVSSAQPVPDEPDDADLNAAALASIEAGADDD